MDSLTQFGKWMTPPTDSNDMIQGCKIRQEEEKDFAKVRSLLQSAFTSEPQSDGTEYLLVERLRLSPEFIKELSLVAEVDDEVVGYALLSPVVIKSDEDEFTSLALAPVAVLPAYQCKGIGSQLIRQIHIRARALGFTSVVVIGHADYYPRFGYKKAREFGIAFPFEVPDQNAMAKELVAGALEKVHGMVIYPDAFQSS